MASAGAGCSRTACRWRPGRGCSAPPFSAFVGFEDEVASDDHAHGEAWSDRQGERDLQLALNDLLSGIADPVLCAVADGSDQAVLVVRGEFGFDGEQCREPGGPGDVPPVTIDTIFEPGLAGSVRTWLAFEHDGAAVGQDQTVPDQQHPALSEGDTGIILADDACALGDQEQAACGTVVDILGDLGDDGIAVEALTV